MERHILTVDVEDNFTYEELADKKDWQKYEGQVVDNTLRILSLLKKYNSLATFFVVGMVAERHPEVIKHIIQNGHEIASHSYWHKPLNSLTIKEVEEDIKMSRDILFSLAGSPILGYRSMGYSIPDDEREFYNLLKKYGYIYSSVRNTGEKMNIQTVINDGMYKVYPSMINLYGRSLVFSGGSYFRILPIHIINRGFSLYRRHNQPVMIYIHPWEFNKDQPKRKVPLIQKVLQSSITFTTEKKLTFLLQRHRFVPVKKYLRI